MHSIEELRDLLEINKNNLEEEIVRQPQLFYEVSEHYTTAASARDVSKQVLEHLGADLASQYRLSATDKITEARVNEYVTANPMYVDQYQKHLAYKARC